MSTAPSHYRSPASIPFKVFAPDSPEPPQSKVSKKLSPTEKRRRLAARITLRQAFEKYLLPDLPPEKKSTISEYRTALNHWERETDNPPIARITNDLLREYRDKLLASGRSAETVRKNWRQLRAVLRRVGPPADRNPLGRGLLKRVPYMRQPSETTKEPRLVTPAELTALFEACSVAKWPACDVPAPQIWRAALVLAHNFGMRTFDLFRLSWDAVDFERKYLTFSAKKTGRLQRLPLNRTVLAWLKAIRGDGSRPTIFHCNKGRKQVYRTWEAINNAAGLSRPMLWKDLRESCNSRLEMIRPGVGKFVLGHKLTGVNERFYLNPGPQIRDALKRMPQPKVFTAIWREPADRQRRLFDDDNDN